MIPKFPTFKKLECPDKADVEKITAAHQAYSDFDFISLWSWNVNDEIKISLLNGNLVVRFSDYITGKPFYSFIGERKTNATISDLISLSLTEGLPPLLKLVPETSLKDYDASAFAVAEDQDNFDYVLSVEKLLPHDGSKRRLSTRRKAINEFKKNPGFEVGYLDVENPGVQALILSVFEKWQAQLDVEEDNVLHLKKALERLFRIDRPGTLLALGVYLDHVLIGYSINEVLPGKYLVGHFQQADLTVFGGIYALLMQEVAVQADRLGKKFINIEQDLGIAGLRKWKSSYHPDFFLKKYLVSRVDKPISI